MNADKTLRDSIEITQEQGDQIRREYRLIGLHQRCRDLAQRTEPECDAMAVCRAVQRCRDLAQRTEPECDAMAVCRAVAKLRCEVFEADGPGTDDSFGATLGHVNEDLLQALLAVAQIRAWVPMEEKLRLTNQARVHFEAAAVKLEALEAEGR